MAKLLESISARGVDDFDLCGLQEDNTDTGGPEPGEATARLAPLTWCGPNVGWVATTRFAPLWENKYKKRVRGQDKFGAIVNEVIRRQSLAPAPDSVDIDVSSAPTSIRRKLPARTRIGFIILEDDYSLEDDVRLLFPPKGCTIHFSRIKSSPDVTVETLNAMAFDMTRAAKLMPEHAEFSVVAFGCTSGSAVIGPARVKKLIKSGCETVDVTNPLTAAIAAIQSLNLKSIALVSPYQEAVNDTLIAQFKKAGIETTCFFSFDEELEYEVSRIHPDDMLDAAVKLANENNGVECIFLSCTNLVTLDIIEKIESETGLCCLSSNLCMLWHVSKLANVDLVEDFSCKLITSVV